MEPKREEKIDFRVYIGILLFHWKVIAVCFLYGLLGGVLYIQFAPKTFEARCMLLIYRDPNLELARSGSPWQSFAAHSFLLTHENLRRQTTKRVAELWGESARRWQSLPAPTVAVGRGGPLPGTMSVSASGSDRMYCEKYLETLVEEHRKEWQSIQMESSDTASGMLQEELTRLEAKITKAEEDLIEYQRLHDIARVEARGSLESRYLMALMERQSQLTTEIMLLDSQYPMLKDANVGVVSSVGALTRETGAVRALKEETAAGVLRGEESEEPEAKLPELPDRKAADDAGKELSRGWQDIRVKISRLQQREKELAENLKPEHPQLKALRKEIEDMKNQLEVAAQVALGNLGDHRKALTIQLKAMEDAEQKWQARNLMASKRRAEIKRIAAVVSRFEGNFSTLYGRLHDLRVSGELRAEHFRVVEPVAADERPVWPDAQKILLVALALGLGSGLGLALVVEIFNNRVQSIHDVEVDLGVPFLGGVPYWVRSRLDDAIRPIVTEEQSAGAVEAYRALRTTVLAAAAKIGEKILIFTSADSREGKTLTVLNMAIMTAQMGKQVLLVDMDLRRGRLHRSLEKDKEPGMSDVLGGKLPLCDAVQRTAIDNLDLIPSGSQVENCAEMLQSTSMASLFSGVKGKYDYIMIDTSPVLRVTDTTIIANQEFGAVVYIARVNRTPKPLIKYSLSLLKDARILGLIMNSIEMNRIGSLYYSYQYPNYAYYSYAYSYGYDYYHYSDERRPGRMRRPRTVTWEDRVRRLKRWFRRTFLPMD